MNILDNPYGYQLSALTIFNIKKVKSLLSERLGLNAGQRTLDICCGTGNFADLAKGEYIGFDINEGYIKYARGRFKGDRLKRFLVSDINDFEFIPEHFDIVLLIGVLHHFSDDAASGLLEKVNMTARDRIVIIDPAVETRNPVSMMLRSLDRGQFIRTLDGQCKLISWKLNILRYYNLNFGMNKMNVIICGPKKP
ncbi:MAG: class I SAM-dependent methyltransferase [Candidatus Omnitrophica bacterium]|nr:class I SAM-dependent methyltransferase [Candidatus Omnitrophota bacterium]